MECNTKWEWENLDGSCFNLPGGGGGGGDDGGSVDCYNSKKKDERDGTYQLEASVCSGESFIGLKLGKRTYFENSYSKDSNITPPVLGIPASSVSTEKKVKTYCQSQSTPISRCQVEGCNLDLSAAKEYHRKHRVCEGHSKCPKVIVAGLERRFCQQCSRFHSMSEFDEEKRSCRRRLSDHNARRRKLQQDPTRFNSPTQYSSFYGTESIDVLSRAAGGVQYSHILNTPTLAPNGGVGFKGATAMISDQDFKESLASHVDGVNLQRVLSLLSNNSWGSCEPYSTARDRLMHSTSPTMVQRNGSPISSHEYREANQQFFNPKIHAQTSTANNRFQESQTFKPPYENSFLYHPNS